MSTQSWIYEPIAIYYRITVILNYVLKEFSSLLMLYYMRMDRVRTSPIRVV